MFKKYNEEKDELIWKNWLILLVELIGTFILVFEIITPSSFNLNNNDVFDAIFGTYVMKAFWMAAFIWILILIFGKISANFNPVVTLAQIVKGKDSVELGLSKIAVQFVGAFAAVFIAYFIAKAAGTWVDTTSTLGGLEPTFNFGNFGGTPNWWVEFSTTNVGINGTQLAETLIPFAIEFILTFILIIAIFWGKNITEKGRSFVVFAAFEVVFTIGFVTHNVALNPARLIAPSLIASSFGGAQTMQYIIIFLAGELTAVLVFWLIENRANLAVGNTMPAVKKQYRIVSGEMLAYKARYEWLLDGNKSLETMNKDELLNASKKLGIKTSKEETRDDLEYHILETLIFGLEKNKKEIKVEKKSEHKKEELKLSKEEIAKRDAMRKAMKEKIIKNSESKSISLSEIKKIKLTDLFGIEPKISEYFNANGWNNLDEISKKDTTKLTQKFINELPTLKSLTPDMKKAKIEAIVSEAKFMIEQIKKIK